MEKTRQEVTLDNARDNTAQQENEKDVRTLKDLELLLVGGGGDDIVNW